MFELNKPPENRRPDRKTLSYENLNANIMNLLIIITSILLAIGIFGQISLIRKFRK